MSERRATPQLVQELVRELPWLTRVCWALSSDQGEDLTQDVCLRILSYGAGFDPARPFRPWAHAIVWRTRNGAAQLRLLPDSPEDASPPAPDLRADPAEIVDARAFGPDVRRMLEALPPRQRDALLLVDAAGLGRADTALRLGLSERAFSSLLLRARRAARVSLQRAQQGTLSVCSMILARAWPRASRLVHAAMHHGQHPQALLVAAVLVLAC